MGYDGEQPVIEIPVMLTEYEISVILEWHQFIKGTDSFDDDLAKRLRSHIPPKNDEGF